MFKHLPLWYLRISSRFQKPQVEDAPELEVPLKQERFLEELKIFRSQAAQIENCITSYSPISDDIIKLGQYRRKITRFISILRNRRREIRKLRRLMRSIEKKRDFSLIEHDQVHHYYW